MTFYFFSFMLYLLKGEVMYTNKIIACSYIRSIIKSKDIHIENNELLSKTLLELSSDDLEELYNIGKKLDLKLYYFKEKEELPRVSIVLGFLKNIYPESILDVGSGRGVFLFPLLKEFPNTNITSIDILPNRLELLNNIKNGGIDNLNVYNEDLTNLSFNDNTFDVVTILEVLEHIPNVKMAIKEAIRVSKKFIVITVPSKEDNNPEHIHLLTKTILTDIFNEYGITNLKFSGVNGHLFLVAKK